MFEDLRRQKAYLWYARYAELNRIQFWQSVCDDVQTLSFRRDPETRVSRLRQELHQLERELGREFLRTVAKQDCWGGMLPDWVVNAGPRKEPNASLERASLQRASLQRASLERASG